MSYDLEMLIKEALEKKLKEDNNDFIREDVYVRIKISYGAVLIEDIEGDIDYEKY